MFEALVLSGGGVKGIAHLGVVNYFQEKGEYDYKHIRKYCGTSIGSILCLLFSVGYSAMDIFNEIYRTSDFFSKTKTQIKMLDIVSNFHKNMGILDIQELTTKIEQMVMKRLGIDHSPTFQQLQAMTGKELIIIGANVTQQREEVFSVGTSPDYKCIDAVKISCNLPFIFHRIKYKGDYCVDGGLLNNFPVDKVDDNRTVTLASAVQSELTSDDTQGFFHYLSGILQTPSRVDTNAAINGAGFLVKVVKVMCPNRSLFNFSISSESKADLLMRGYNAAKEVDIVYSEFESYSG